MANIVFLGNFEVPYSSENHHAKSLESLGHTVDKLQEKKATSEKILRRALSSDLFIWVHTHGWKTPGEVPMDQVLIELKKANVQTVHSILNYGLVLNRPLFPSDPPGR